MESFINVVIREQFRCSTWVFTISAINMVDLFVNQRSATTNFRCKGKNEAVEMLSKTGVKLISVHTMLTDSTFLYNTGLFLGSFYLTLVAE